MTSYQEELLEHQETLVDNFINRAAAYLNTALLHLEDQKFFRFFSDAGTAIELLGKGVLANLSPALIVPNNFPSLITVLGLPVPSVRSRGRVRTITAKEVLTRVVSVLESLEPHKKALLEIVHIRNGTVHYIDAPDHEFAHLVASLREYLFTCAEHLEVSVTPRLISSEHSGLLNEFKGRDKDIWRALAGVRIAAARKDLTGGTNPVPADLVWPTEPRESSQVLPESIVLSGMCAACGDQTEFQYWKKRGAVLKDEEEGIMHEIEYRLKGFACTKCELELENPWLCEGAQIPLVAELPQGWQAEFEENRYAYWGWNEEFDERSIGYEEPEYGDDSPEWL